MSRPQESEGTVSTIAHDVRVAIVVARYHRAIVDALHAGASEHFFHCGGVQCNLTVVEAPGAFELPLLAQSCAQAKDIDAVVCLGCVLTGETSHDRYICDAVAHGILKVSLASGKPVAFGVLTCQTEAQARARAGGDHGNKGIEAMQAALASLQSIKVFKRNQES
ncbi:MAG: 6,7-dimethyl-8-ribityllumazine synthase [Planctomycetota bacterium]|nr:6,7-dimethyl-8-ribityllumazine synthase [Planctomycetota bacterium]